MLSLGLDIFWLYFAQQAKSKQFEFGSTRICVSYKGSLYLWLHAARLNERSFQKHYTCGISPCSENKELGKPLQIGGACSFYSFCTNNYKLHFFEAPSGVKVGSLLQLWLACKAAQSEVCVTTRESLDHMKDRETGRKAFYKQSSSQM